MNRVENEPTLYVDLDGTLIATDLLYESFLSVVKRSPWSVLLCIGWLAKGRARLKEELSLRSTIDVATLPYREAVIDFLRDERARGRRIVMATASWSTLAEAVASHLGLFDEVLSTTVDSNLKGEVKAMLLVGRNEGEEFDYVGDSRADIAVWRRARHAYVVDDTGKLAEALPAEVEVRRVFSPLRPRSSWNAALLAMRPHQWAKNLLVFMPLVAAHRLGDSASLIMASLGFAAFCLLASSAYLLNDLLDLEADRAHPRKRFRPLASGRLSIPWGLGLFAMALAGGGAIAALLTPMFHAALVAYFVLTLSYSFGLKRVAILDVVSLAALYTLRIIAGGFAIAAPPSFWLLAFAMFLFFSLALVKRYAELVTIEGEGIGTAPGRGYGGHDIDIILAIGSASAMVSALVLALYINGESVKELYSRPALLWILCPILLYWVSRVWLLAARGQMHDDPVLFAVRDKASYVVALTGALVVWLAT